MPRIDRCYCYEKTFRELKGAAEESGAETVEELQSCVTFGEDCGLCHPYVARMLKTGTVVFSETIEAQP